MVNYLNHVSGFLVNNFTPMGYPSFPIFTDVVSSPFTNDHIVYQVKLNRTNSNTIHIDPGYTLDIFKIQLSFFKETDPTPPGLQFPQLVSTEIIFTNNNISVGAELLINGSPDDRLLDFYDGDLPVFILSI